MEKLKNLKNQHHILYVCFLKFLKTYDKSKICVLCYTHFNTPLNFLC